jgi:hypothetical protein
VIKCLRSGELTIHLFLLLTSAKYVLNKINYEGDVWKISEIKKFCGNGMVEATQVPEIICFSLPYSKLEKLELK